MVWACRENGWVPYGRRVFMVDVSGGWVRGRPRLGWKNLVKMTLGSRGMTVEAARQCTKR